jgi:signal transduction histidine kinase
VQVTVNILSNSLKFSKRDSAIKLTLNLLQTQQVKDRNFINKLND